MNKVNEISIIETENEQLKEKNNNKNKFKTDLVSFIYLFIFFFILALIFVIFLIFKLFNKLLFEIEYFKNQSKSYSKEINKNSINKDINDFNLYRMLCPKEVIGKRKIIIGNYSDGGYVLLDDFKDIKIAYSFGISNLISFDKDLADKGIDIYMYDHTINNLPFNHQRFHWKKLGITSESKKKENMKTLKELLFDNDHFKESNMILKIDIEQDEWDILNEITDDILKKFKYIVLELHFRNLDEYQKYFNSLNKLLKNHQIFHIHCCNCGGLLSIGNTPICNVLEVSYIIKEGNIFTKNNSTYPMKEFNYKICIDRNNLDYEPNILKFCDKE